MTHEELVERVAMALCNVQQPTGAWSRGSDEYREIFRHEARAAIAAIAEALKEPTPWMERQGGKITKYSADPATAWKAMHASSPLYPKE